MHPRTATTTPGTPHGGVQRARPTRIFSVGIAALLLFAGCHDPLPADPTLTAAQDDDQALIGGFAANDRRLDAVGSLTALFPPFPVPPGLPPQPPPQPIVFCSAGLVTPETVVTAKHCAELVPFVLAEGGQVFFNLGPDGNKPRRRSEIVAFAFAPQGPGSSPDDLRRDVAVVHLDDPLTGEPTVALGALSDADLGKAFTGIGYGVQDMSDKSDTRRLGKLTLRAREGKFFEVFFGTFERFFEWLLSGELPPETLAILGERTGTASAAPAAPDAGVADGGPGGGGGAGGANGAGGAGGSGGSDDELRKLALQIYNSVVLEKDYEVAVGGAPGDAQICFGDSGSPLIRKVDGKYVAYGVAATTLTDRRRFCDIGGSYATFGPDVMAFLARELHWTDPCDKLGSAGICDGTVARRCTTPAEGRRRVVEFDCSSLDLECSATGAQVLCGDMALNPPPPPPPTGPRINVTQQAQNAFSSPARR